MNPYIYALIFAGTMVLIAAVISNLIKYEGGSNPKDPRRRKICFWIIAVLDAALFILAGMYLLAPNPADDQMVYDDFMKALPIAAAVSLVAYILFGFVLSKLFKHGKISQWV